MKTVKRILNLMLVPAAVSLSLSGCSNDIMDKINFNPNDPTNATADYILPDVITRTALYTIGGDLPLYASVYMEIEAGVHGQTWNADRRVGEPIASTTYNNAWGSIYTNIRNIKTIINKCDEGSSGGPITKGMAQTLMALNIGTLTNYFGDVPYSETGILNESGMLVYPQPKVESQKAIYEEIFKLLNEAETNLKAGSGAPASSSDWLYVGNVGRWVKAVNALKARYTLQLLHVSENPTADLDAILGYIDASFTSAADQMSYAQFDVNLSYNPFGAYFFSRGGIGASQSFVKLLVEKKDPRIMQYGFDDFSAGWVDKIEDWVTDNMDIAPNGQSPERQFNFNSWAGYTPSYTYFAEWAPVLFMSYHELMFIKAEILARKGGTNDDALAALKTAVLAACANMDSYFNDPWMTGSYEYAGRILPATAEEYFVNTVAPAFAVDALKEIMIQKYIACSGASAEAHVAYDDYRRLSAMGEGDYLTLQNPENAKTLFPLRFSYGADDVAANPNITTLYGNGQYVYTENVWWAGGSR